MCMRVGHHIMAAPYTLIYSCARNLQVQVGSVQLPCTQRGSHCARDPVLWVMLGQGAGPWPPTYMPAPQRCKNRSPRHLRERMLPRNAARRHTCHQSSPKPPLAGTAPLPVENGYSNRGSHLEVSLIRMVELDMALFSPLGRRGGSKEPTREKGSLSNNVRWPREATR